MNSRGYLQSLLIPPGLHPVTLHFRSPIAERKWQIAQEGVAARGLLVFMLVMIVLRSVGDAANADEPDLYNHIQWWVGVPALALALLLLRLRTPWRFRLLLPWIIDLLVLAFSLQFAFTAAHMTDANAIYLFGSVALLLLFNALLLGLPAVHAMVTNSLAVAGYLWGIHVNAIGHVFREDASVYVGLLYFALLVAARHNEIGARRLFLSRREAADARTAAERALAQLNSATEARLGWLRSMSHVLGHELQSPMAVVYRSLRDARHMTASDTAILELLQRAEHHVERVSSMIQSARDASRLEDAVRSAERAPTDLSRLIGRYVDDISVLPQYQKINLRFTPCGVLRIQCSSQHIEQLLDKLLSNAADFSEAGSDVEVILTQSAADQSAEARPFALIHVRNRGPLLSEAAEELFKPFRSARPEGMKTGTNIGVGLYIARIIARSHDGELTAQDLPDGSGVEFVVSLPLAEYPESASV